MFCYQCEQTAGCSGCTGKAGVCGKKEDTARLQDQLTGALIGLARSTDGNEWALKDSTAAIVVEGLFATLTNVNFDNEALQRLIDRVEEEKARLIPDCAVCASPCGKQRRSSCGGGPLRQKQRLRYGKALDCGRGYPFPQIPDPFRNPRHGGLRLPCGSPGL